MSDRRGSLVTSPLRNRSTKIWYQTASFAHSGTAVSTSSGTSGMVDVLADGLPDGSGLHADAINVTATIITAITIRERIFV